MALDELFDERVENHLEYMIMLDYRPEPDLGNYVGCDGKAVELVWELWAQIMKLSMESFKLNHKGDYLKTVLKWLSS